MLRQSGPNIFIECPGCDSRKQKCSIHINKGIGNCFRASCPLHGGFGFAKLITYLDHVAYSEALSIAVKYSDEIEKEYVAKTFGTNRNYPINSLPIQELLNKANTEFNKLCHQLAQYGVDYLVNKRGLDEQQIETYQLGVGWENYSLGNKEILRYGMIIIPIFFNQEIVSYCGRSIEFTEGPMFGLLGKQKHIHAERGEDYLSVGQILFNCDKAIPQARKQGYLVIVEDAWSAIKLNCVATLGSNLSDDQIYILVNNWKGPIVICRDNDVGGNKAALIDAKKLANYYSDIRIAKPIGIDPDDNLEATQVEINSAKPVDLFQLKLSHLLTCKK